MVTDYNIYFYGDDAPASAAGSNFIVDWNRFTFNTPSIILSILNFRKGCRK